MKNKLNQLNWRKQTIKVLERPTKPINFGKKEYHGIRKVPYIFFIRILLSQCRNRCKSSPDNFLTDSLLESNIELSYILWISSFPNSLEKRKRRFFPFSKLLDNDNITKMHDNVVIGFIQSSYSAIWWWPEQGHLQEKDRWALHFENESEIRVS